jgi:zinc finger protein
MDFSKGFDNQVANHDIEEEDITKEVLSFPTECYSCGLSGEARMCIASIPFFKEIIIMAFSCEFCGYRNTEIKGGGGISEKATKIVFKVTEPVDMNRDIFKSDSCHIEIPEVEFEMAPGTLGSVYTTTEGLLDKVKFQ